VYILGNANEERYNRAHKSTRNIVERVFGVYKRRFPCLYKGLTTKIETSQAIICATATLYNLGIKFKDDFIFEDEDGNMNDDIQNINVEYNQLGLVFRNEFIQNNF